MTPTPCLFGGLNNMTLKSFGNFCVSAIGQGAGGNDICSDVHRVRVLEHGIDLGMTLIDTAESYRGGLSEKIVGRAIAGKRDSVFVCTKFSPSHNDYSGVVNSINGSLHRLKTDYIDLYQIHWPNPSIPIHETMQALMDLKKSGKILHIGVSNFSLPLFLEAQKVCGEQIASNQVEYNLLNREIENSYLPLLNDQPIMTLAYNPLHCPKSGRALLETLACKYTSTCTQVILKWLISHKSVVPIPKTLSLDHTRENAAAADIPLDNGDIQLINDAFRRNIVYVTTSRVRVLSSLNEDVYVSLEDALNNRFNFVPSPSELASDLKINPILKPIRIRNTTDNSGRFDYDLIQGRNRYWAWIIANGIDVPIPALLET